MNRKTFRQVALLRLKEAKVLLDNDCPQGAYYLCGYAVECALKACLARKGKSHWTHDLKHLLDEVGGPLVSKMENHPKWATVVSWSEDKDKRYSIGATEQLSRDLYRAVDGVLKCIKEYW